MRIGIIGGAGYTAGELLRLLLNHPEAEIAFVQSSSHAGCPVAEVHEGLIGETSLCFTDKAPLRGVDILFFCQGHGKSREFLDTHRVPKNAKIVDLAQDFRLKETAGDFVYGLPELNRAAIAAAQHVANPGCFATCIQLGLLPLASNWLLLKDITVNAVTGSTGAGVKPTATTHFSWRQNNLSVYKAFQHQHVPEIRQSLAQMQPGFKAAVDFIPWRGDFARGIFATAVVDLGQVIPYDDLVGLYKTFYADAAFTHYSDTDIDLKQVVNTNKCLVHIQQSGTKVLVTSVIDNLLKGASGQAVQNMNLMTGLPEDTGLRLKASAF